MSYQKNLDKYRYLENQIKEIKKRLEMMPEGKLLCTGRENSFKWYNSDGHKHVYIPKRNRDFAEKLAAKKYLNLKLEYLMREKRALEFYLKHHSELPDRAEDMLMNHPGYYELLAPYFKPKDEQLVRWMEEPYERNLKYPENLIHKTSSGIYVRSKSEAIIELALHTSKIPFRYECALCLDGITLYPDFTIMHPETQQIYYYEHFGRMDDVSYARNACSKLQLYATHGIIPSIQLITTYETKEKPLNYEDVMRIVEQYFL